MDDLNRTHKIYGHVTEDEFYAGLNEAKMENILVDEKGWVDIGELIHEMWVAFSEGRMAIVPKEGFHRPEKVVENTDGECHCTLCEMERNKGINDNPILMPTIVKKLSKKRTTKAKTPIESHEGIVQEA